MNVAEVKALAEKYPLDAIRKAIQEFEENLNNVLNVNGKDDGEKLSHLLVTEIVLVEMSKGLNFHEALRTYTSRVRSMIKPANKK